jgi:hypothetical protein
MKILLVEMGTGIVLIASRTAGSWRDEVKIYRGDAKEKICDSSSGVLEGFVPIKEAPAPTIPRYKIGYMISLVSLESA